jgi:hypothetical protein
MRSHCSNRLSRRQREDQRQNHSDLLVQKTCLFAWRAFLMIQCEMSSPQRVVSGSPAGAPVVEY